MKNRINSEKGMVIVEASIVFPVMFLVIFLMLFTGNAYYQKCRVDAVVNQLAIKGASYCADPPLKTIEKGSIPPIESHDVMPYRYLITGHQSTVEQEINTELNKKLKEMGSGLLLQMEPKSIVTNVKYNNGFIYSTFSIEVQYKIKIPVLLLGADDYIYLNVSTRVNMPVSDSTEFIRNADMVEDYVQRTGLADKISEVIEKVQFWKGD